MQLAFVVVIDIHANATPVASLSVDWPSASVTEITSSIERLLVHVNSAVRAIETSAVIAMELRT